MVGSRIMSLLLGLLLAFTGTPAVALQPSVGDRATATVESTASYPNSPSNVRPVRIAGVNRYATAATMARSWPARVPTAFVVGGEGFADTLSAAARAGAQRSPLLLTRRDAVPPETVAELERLRPERIVVVGGASAVSNTVLTELKRHSTSGRIQRVSGTDRYATSVAVSRLYPAGAELAYLASGEDFPDALGGAALAGYRKAPLLLTRRGQLDPRTSAELARLAPQQIIVLGGPAAVSASVLESAAPLSASPVRRVAGVDRYNTAAAVAAEYPAGSSTAYVASGTSFPDALIGAAPAARDGVPLLLTPKDRVHSATDRALARQQPREMYVLGGEKVISPSTMATLAGYLTDAESAETFTPLGASTTFDWSGARWSAKESASAGPGPNRWDRSGVEIGDRGSMKLRVKPNAKGGWEAAEVVRDGSTGYGTFTFNTTSSVLPTSDRSVLGMFTYQHLSPEEGHEEIDIEYSRWGKPGTGPGTISTHKPDPAWTREFPLGYTGPLTHSFLWSPGYVKWTIVRDDTGTALHQREMWGDEVPRFIDARMRINLWLLDGLAPANAKPFEVTLSSARWTPLAPGFSPPKAPVSVAKTATLTDTFDELNTATWPGAHQYGQPTVPDGRLRIPLGPGYHGVQSNKMYALNNSSITVDQIRPPTVDAQSESEIAFVRDQDHSVHVFTVGPDTGRVRIRTGGVDRNLDFAYDPMADRWLRIRHDGSRLHVETSPDGWDWNPAVPAQPAPSWVADAIGQVKLGGGNWQSQDPAGKVRFDNLNVSP